jgi:hypothetical protein
MKRVMVRYRVRPDAVERNEELVRAVYASLAELAPPGLQYATYKLDDGVSFVHLAAYEGDSPLPRVEAFREFSSSIRDRCDEAPVVTELEEVGAYGRT